MNNLIKFSFQQYRVETPEMRIIFHLPLVLSVACCSVEQIFETKTVRVGENINLTCTRRDVGTLFWIKLVSGNFPKILGRSFSSQGDDQRIRTGTEPGTFVLYITKAQQSDTGVYICMKTPNRELTFLNGISLKIEAPEPAFSAAPPSDPVHLEHKVTLQCSVLHDFQNKTCPTDDSVFCLSTKSNKSHPKYTHMNAGDDYENNSEELSTKKCVYSYFRNFSTSDFQRYYCIVATCVESEDKVKGNTEALNTSVSKKETIFLYLLSAALAISLIAVASLIYSINKLKKKSYVDCNAAIALQADIISSGDQRTQPTDEDTLVYSTPTFKKVRNSRTRDTKHIEEESIYTGVKVPALD